MYVERKGKGRELGERERENRRGEERGGEVGGGWWKREDRKREGGGEGKGREGERRGREDVPLCYRMLSTIISYIWVIKYHHDDIHVHVNYICTLTVSRAGYSRSLGRAGEDFLL